MDSVGGFAVPERLSKSELSRKGTDIRDLAIQYFGRGSSAGLLGRDLAMATVDGEVLWRMKKSDLVRMTI